MIKYRLLSSILFATAAGIFWCILALFFGGFKLTEPFGIIALVSTIITGFFLGNRFGTDAKNQNIQQEGYIAGIIVTAVSYMIGVLIMAGWIIFNQESSTGTIAAVLETFGFTLLAGLVYSFIFLPVSLPIGALFGRLFFYVVRKV